MATKTREDKLIEQRAAEMNAIYKAAKNFRDKYYYNHSALEETRSSSMQSDYIYCITAFSRGVNEMEKVESKMQRLK